MKQWWEDFNDELQKSTPFIVFTTWLILVLIVGRIVLRGAK